jgi:hypothetical protein
MRGIIVLTLLVLAGCGRSQQDLDNAVAAERAAAEQRLQEQRNEQNAAMAAQDCANREARMLAEHRDAIARDRQVIMTTLEGVSNAAGNAEAAAALEFAINIETLDPAGWRWVEVENSAAVSGYEQGSLRDRINYSVNPAQLSGRVQLVNYAGMPAVRFDCVSGNCIRAIGRRLAHYNGRDALQDIDEGRAYNVWALGTANRAQVVRDALADLIGRTSSPPVSGTCGASEASNAQ